MLEKEPHQLDTHYWLGKHCPMCDKQKQQRHGKPPRNNLILHIAWKKKIYKIFAKKSKKSASFHPVILSFT